MAVDEQVTGHYGRPGMLQAILGAAEKAGLDPDALAASDLSAVDEFHLGGLAATRSLFDLLDPAPGSRLLDVGSGIGGPARVAASQYGCTVTGVDLTPEFTELATDLTARVGLDDRVSFQTADAVALPFPDGSFDLATLIHVGMNMPEKARVFAEVRRVLETGGRFAIYDQMLTGTEQPAYPAAVGGGRGCVVPVHHAGVPHDALRRRVRRGDRGGPHPGRHRLLRGDGGRRRRAGRRRSGCTCCSGPSGRSGPATTGRPWRTAPWSPR